MSVNEHVLINSKNSFLVAEQGIFSVYIARL